MMAFFKDLEKKAAFLKELYEDDHKDEALLLCCCYLERILSTAKDISLKSGKLWGRMDENIKWPFIRPN